MRNFGPLSNREIGLCFSSTFVGDVVTLSGLGIRMNWIVFFLFLFYLIV